jgi:formylglycine-generating enzyme required for sulfatase activity
MNQIFAPVLMFSGEFGPVFKIGEGIAGLTADEGDRRLREQRFKYTNHPRETVNWYQAMAFCRWLSWRLTGRIYTLEEIAQWPVRLPTEIEWEIAARGKDGRIYPYAGEFDAGKGNTHETGIRKTSAVGIFPGGASPYGQLDMSGNVWEWCINPSDEPDGGLQPENLRSNARRVLRGGSWYDGHGNARAVCRDFSNPDHRGYFNGFRVCRPPS